MIINVIDIVHLVCIILEDYNCSGFIECSDVNQDNEINVIDIISIVNLILS